MVETRNVLFLGASYGGSSSAHYYARHVYPLLPKDNSIAYRAIIVDPSSKFFLKHASPRAAVSDELIPNKLIFLNTVEGFEQYGQAVTFLQGSAIAWNAESRTVVVRRTDGSEESISYHALILATGSKNTSPLFSLQGASYTDTQAAFHRLRSQLPTAKTVVVVGGGPTGVEIAAEISESLNGAAGWFSSRPSNPRTKVMLFTNSSKLLPVLRESIAKQAETYLNRVGVDVVFNTKIVAAKTRRDGKTEIVLHDGTEIIADIYIPAFGLTPVTDYVPKHLLSDSGYIKTNPETLRVDEAGPRVYAVGDVASASRNSIIDIMDMVPVVATNLKRDLLAAHDDLNAKPSGADRLWKPKPAETQVVPIGRSKGVGAAMGWRLPSFLVWLIKGRNYMVTESGVKDRLMGEDWKKESAWKGE